MKTETELLSDLHLAMYDLERADQTLASSASAIDGAVENLARVKKRVGEELGDAHKAKVEAEAKISEAKAALKALWKDAP